MSTETEKNTGTHRDVELEISGMTCASCAARIEKNLNRIDGVEATVNYATEKAKARVPEGVEPEHLIATVEQTVIEADENTQTGGSARLVIGTHKAREQDLSETVERLAASGVVERVVSVLRVEGN